MSDSIASRLERLKTGKLTKSQRKLLEYFETVDYQHIIYLSITDLAEETKMAEATVLRFCRSLGFNGYQEFKLSLAQGLINVGYKQTEGIEYVGNITADYRNSIDQCRKSLTPELLQSVFDLLLSARTVSCFGAGSSHMAAMEFHERLLRMGILSHCEGDAFFQNELISSCGENDVAVLFSVSGGTKDVIEVAELARANGMKIIVITGYENSPLTRFADLVLVAKSIENPTEGNAMFERAAQLFLVDVICTGLHCTDKARFDRCVSKSSIAVSGKQV